MDLEEARGTDARANELRGNGARGNHARGNQARGNTARENEAYWCMIMPLFRAACHPSVLFSVYLLGPQAKPHFTPRDN
jgi:hypothetical protein